MVASRVSCGADSNGNCHLGSSHLLAPLAARESGILRDLDKSQLPASMWCALGVWFNHQSLQSQQTLIVQPKPKRRLNIIREILKVISDLQRMPSTSTWPIMARMGPFQLL